MTSSWDKMCILECTSIPKFKKEGFYDGSPFVTKVIMPGVLSATVPRSFDNILSRRITNGTIEFQNRYPNMTPDNFEADISRTKHNILVPLTSPVIMYLNSHPTTEKKITSASPGFEMENQVKLSLEVGEKMINLTKENMKNNISYGDVTNNFSFAVSVPLPPNLKSEHRKFLDNHKEGTQFKGFADPIHAISLGSRKTEDASVYNSYLNTPQFINAEIKVTYLRCNGKKIPLKI
jgi:hypothetical protein